jgi:FkbM family methyltransferase
MAITEILKNWKHKYPNKEWLADEKKITQYQNVISKSPAIYMRPHDIISLNPMTRGYHEKDVEAFIKWASLSGFSNFLIDVGANIGLTTCLAGENYKNIYCFEPNILVRRILETNLDITFNKQDKNIKVFPFGLGNQELSTTITIPKKNFGGAFIIENNQYSQDVLASKDGFKSFDQKNYLNIEIKVKSLAQELAPIFNLSAQENLEVKGLVKLDVEGYELVLLQELYKILPIHSEILVVFENHVEGQSLKYTDIPKSSISLFEIIHKPLKGPRFLRILKSKYLNATGEYFLQNLHFDHLTKGNIVAHINKTS